MAPRRNPDTYDPVQKLEYVPPQYTNSARYYQPDENSGYYLSDEHEDRGAPVQLTDDMIMRAHYLELGMSHLLQKYREGRLSDAEYIQYHRMNGELRPLLNHIWNVGKRALKYWTDNHLRGGNARYGIGLFDIKQLIDTLQQLGLSPDPALAELKPIVGSTEDWQDDLKRYSIGAPQLYDSYEYEDEDQELYDDALAQAGISDLDEVVPTDQDKWNFLKERLKNWYDEDEMASARLDYGDKGPTPLWQKKVTSWGVDTANPELFLSGKSEFEEGDDFTSQRGGYLNDEDWYQESPHVGAYADLRSNPEYQAAIDDEMAKRWNPVNNMQTHRELLRELDMSDEEWEALDTQTQMALMSRLFQAQHRTGNILTDMVPSFQFTSGLYEPRGDWVGWKSGDGPSLESNALRKILDDLHQSSMVNGWDRYFEQNPNRRWSMMRDDMVRVAMALDARGAYDLADRMDGITQQGGQR